MPVSFNNIPAVGRYPLYLGGSGPLDGGTSILPPPALLVGYQKGGNAVANQPIMIASQLQANVAFGPGSELTLMFRAFFANSFSQEVWGLPLAEGDASAAARRRKRRLP